MSVAYWDPFLYICYDAVPAKVSAITADAVSEKTRGVIFPATLAFDAHAINVDGMRIKLAPGMNLAAKIRTDQNLVIDYLLNPTWFYEIEFLNARYFVFCFNLILFCYT